MEILNELIDTKRQLLNKFEQDIKEETRRLKYMTGKAEYEEQLSKEERIENKRNLISGYQDRVKVLREEIHRLERG